LAEADLETIVKEHRKVCSAAGTSAAICPVALPTEKRGGSPMPTQERIAPVGCINDERRHALISIYHPALLNASPDLEFVQVAISIDGAVALRAALDAFLAEGSN
jgi:hypothetical protein